MPVEQADPLEVEAFLEHLRVHVDYDDEGKPMARVPMGEMTAAFAVGWTPRKLRALKRDKEFVQLIAEAKSLLTESIEAMAIRNALAGNQRAIELYLFCHASDKGWRPPTQKHEHVVSGRAEVAIVASVQEAVTALLSEGDIRAIQEADIEDAEVVEDDG